MYNPPPRPQQSRRHYKVKQERAVAVSPDPIKPEEESEYDSSCSSSGDNNSLPSPILSEAAEYEKQNPSINKYIVD